MNYDTDYAYEKVLCIYIRGDVDEGQPGYVIPEEDSYLKGIQTKIHEEFVRNVWEGKKINCWDVLKSEIDGPSSSGYENTLTIIIGFNKNVHQDYDKPTPRWIRFEEMIKEFAEKEK
jgi:hypothetical protein